MILQRSSASTTTPLPIAATGVITKGLPPPLPISSTHQPKLPVPLYLVILLALSLLPPGVASRSGSRRCATGQYREFDEETGEGRCVPCSPCSPNQIVRVPCSSRGNADTVCGPFLEFEYFNQRRGGSQKVRILSFGVVYL